MAIDNEMVKQVAFLARLKVEDSKVESTKEEFNNILAWVEQLKEVNTDNVEPLVAVNDTKLVVRDDEVADGNLKEAVLKNAPMQEFGYFAVPKVVE
ncbi:MAG: Asp-tRNA(Asn)/Glu-tRNA(Gln) amidotransferase subunit GatC [Alphaproteobacteria bacterium]|nr:Asp-tRNA(Asn)/Glu-tRNA(Gln) amidotransferase subunit GatC [Alphaproteobacteria bacterium]MBR6327345.1 Asp-tRNA(Asn)/Glu-tRNA(Gln) amidotransferase subunit GatC [Alphaproteobacteria bacterium]